MASFFRTRFTVHTTASKLVFNLLLILPAQSIESMDVGEILHTGSSPETVEVEPVWDLAAKQINTKISIKADTKILSELWELELSSRYHCFYSTVQYSTRPVGQPGCGRRLPQPGQQLLTIGEELLGYHNNNNCLYIG